MPFEKKETTDNLFFSWLLSVSHLRVSISFVILSYGPVGWGLSLLLSCGGLLLSGGGVGLLMLSGGI